MIIDLEPSSNSVAYRCETSTGLGIPVVPAVKKTISILSTVPATGIEMEGAGMPPLSSPVVRSLSTSSFESQAC